MAQMVYLVIYSVVVTLLLELGAAVPVHSSHGSNDLMDTATEEALKKLWKGFRAVDYTVVSANHCHFESG